MERQEIFDRLGKVFVANATSEVDWQAVGEDTEIESLGFDSLAILDLLFDLDDEFGLTIEAKEILEIKTIGQMVTFLEERL